ncbi:hypothetical protein NC651_000155 [Populus alba x Populus x berolinensis]|nr:hypothetical protein NC651_000155 [Populus alba x Populus x berolinensis]
MTVPVTGIAPESSSVSVQSIYNAAVHFCIANQLTDTLIEMCGSALKGRVLLPQDELERFGLCDEDVFSIKVTDNWREFNYERGNC